MNVEVVVEDLENNPQCFHGPCLLFRRNSTHPKEYYACSACRDRKECSFYLDALQYKSKPINISKWIDIRTEAIQKITSRNPYKKYIKILKSIKDNKICNTKTAEYVSQKHKRELKKKIKQNLRDINLNLGLSNSMSNVNNLKEAKKCKTSPGYCYSCEELVMGDDIKNHEECNMICNLSKYQLLHPTEIIIPKEDSKTHAQYFFTKDTVKNIVLLLTRIHTCRVLCIGAPRIHEYLLHECNNQFESMLLDIDLKYYNFYNEKQFIWYNMFNNCILKEGSSKTLENFLCSEKLTVLIDPPFGGRVEPLAFTLNALKKLYHEVNNKHNSRGE